MPDIPVCFAGSNAAVSGSTTLAVTIGSDAGGGGNFAFPTIQDECIIVCGGAGTAVPTGIGDSGGNPAYTLAGNTIANPASYIFYCPKAKPLHAAGSGFTADTVTVTYSGTGTGKQAVVLSVPGLTGSPLDSATVNTASGSSTTPSVSTAAALSQGREFIVAVCVHGGAANITWPNPWQPICTAQTGSGSWCSVAVRRNYSGSPTINANPTLGSSQAWTITIAGFKAVAGSQKGWVGSTCFDSTYSDTTTRWGAEQEFDTNLGRTPCAKRSGVYYYEEGHTWGTTAANDPKAMVSHNNSHPSFVPLACLKPMRDGATTGDSAELNAEIAFVKMVRNNGVLDLRWVLWQECNYGGGHSSFGDGTEKNSQNNDPWAVGGPVPPPSGGWTTDDATNHYHAYCNYYGPPLLMSGYLVAYKPLVASPKSMITFFPGRAYGTGSYINNQGGCNEVLVDIYSHDTAGDSSKNLYTMDTLTRGTLNNYTNEGNTYDYSFSPPIPMGCGETGVSDSSANPDTKDPGYTAGFYNNDTSGAKTASGKTLPYPGITPLMKNRISAGFDVGIIDWYDAGAPTGQNQCTSDGKINGRKDIGDAYRALWDALSPDSGVTGNTNATVTATAIACTTKLRAPTVISGGSTTVSPTFIDADATLVTPAVTANLSTITLTAIKPTIKIPTPLVNQAPVTPGVLIRPRTIVEAGFHSHPITGDRVWDNITDFVDLQEGTLSIQARRQSVFDERSPATFSCVLDNDNGEFTDDNALSPYYPDVKFNTPIRARMQYPSSQNLLSDIISNTADINGWTPEQGTLSVDTSSPAPGTNSSIVWATGKLKQTIVHVIADEGIWGAPGSRPIHVKAGEAYSASIALKADGTISCSLRMAWYDLNGNKTTFATSGVKVLTSSWQTVTINNAVAPADGTMRISVVNETTVYATTPSISFSGSTSKTAQSATSMTLDYPEACSSGDAALVWIRISDNSLNVSTPSGWTQRSVWDDARGTTYLYEKNVSTDDLGSTVTFTLDFNSDPCRWFAAIMTYDDVDQNARIHQSIETNESVVRNTHTTPSVTTTVANCRIISACFDISSTTTNWSVPLGEFLREVGFCIKGNAATGIITDGNTNVAAGTYGSKTFTSNSKTKYATMHSVALKPTPSTGSNNVNVSIGAPMVVKGTSVPPFSVGGTWYDLITAYVDEWAPYWDLDHALISVSGTDRSKLLSNIQVDSAISESTMDLDPIGYYKLDESGSGSEDTTTTCADSTENNQPPLAPVKRGSGAANGDSDPIEFGAGKSPGVDGTPALIINPADHANGYYLVAEHLNEPLGGEETSGVTVSFFWRSTDANAFFQTTMLKFSPVTASGQTRSWFEFYGQPNNFIAVKAGVQGDGANFSCNVQLNGNFHDGITRHLAATLDMSSGNAVLTLFKNGVNVGSDTHSTSISDVKRMNAMSVGNSYPNQDRLCVGTYSNIAFYNYVLKASDMQNIYNAGNNAFRGESVTDRIYRVLDWEDISGTDLDRSDVQCDRHMPDETSLLDVLQLIAATDGGTVYINGNDQIAFRSSLTKEKTATPALAISASDLAVQPQATQNDSLLVNDMTVNRLGAGNSQRVVRNSSITQNGRHEKSIDTLVYTDQEAASMAGYFIAFYSEPITRFDTLQVEALLLDDLSGVMAAAQEMWSEIQVTDMPSTSPASVLNSYAEGVGWEISNDSWMVTFDVSPVIPFAVLGDPNRDVLGSVVVAR